jgi:MoxR-like ATPase
MEERQVSSDGETHPLDPLFTVFATENPLEFEGTYPLPEAQLDRFLLKIIVGYPSLEEERLILMRQQGHQDRKSSQSDANVAVLHPDRLDGVPLDRELLRAAQQEVRAVTAEPALIEYLLAMVRRTRDWPTLLLGASPRAAGSLFLVAKGFAARDGRDFLLPDDVKEAALPVLRHRLVLRPEAELEGLDNDRIIGEILASTPLPK